MRFRTALLLVSSLFSPALTAHDITPRSLTVFAGREGEFDVIDHSGCQALISASVDDATIATISPASATGASVRFTVSGTKAGTTKITVQWVGQGSGCNDVGSGKVDLVVKSGPDLVLGAYSSTMEHVDLGPDAVRYRCREGDRNHALNFMLYNFGNEEASGFVRIRITLPPQLRFRPLPPTCEHTGELVECTASLDPPLEPFQSLEPADVFVPFECFDAGIGLVTGRVNGPDVDETNNYEEIYFSVEPGRAGVPLKPPSLWQLRGRNED